MVHPPLSPGATIGILGGGQLGRMIALAAARLGLKTAIYCDNPESPAFDVAAFHVVGDYDDHEKLASFAERVDRITYEFENIALDGLATLHDEVRVLPGIRSLEVSQDRLLEKRFIADLGLPVTPFAPVETAGDLRHAAEALGLPAVVKTRRLGYDGKGQVLFRAGDDPSKALATIGNVPAILEAFVDFDCEVSAIVARSADGGIAAYDIARNLHENHILRTSRVPARIDANLAAAAGDHARRMADALDHVGVLAVEFFVCVDNVDQPLVINEIAPRVHNSGHWTEDAAMTSQFEQHVRAVAGWPLGSSRRLFDVEMTNLLGSEAANGAELAKDPDARVHLYGKHRARPGRKMGHVNRISRP